jgi:hypothetical protein
LLRRYGIFAVTWLVVVAGLVAVMSLHYRAALAELLPGVGPWVVLVALWMGLLLPPLVVVGPPLVERVRRGRR